MSWLYNFLVSDYGLCLTSSAGIGFIAWVEWRKYKKMKAFKKAQTMAQLGHRYHHNMD